MDKLCVSKLGGRAGGQARGGRRKCRTKNKNPTQRCGEQAGIDWRKKENDMELLHGLASN